MWRNHLLRVALGVILLALVAGIAAPDVLAAAAQGRVRIIPVRSKWFHYQLSPDGRIVATFEESIMHDNEVLDEYLPIRLFDIRSGEEIGQLTGHTDYTSSVAFSPDGTLLVSYHQNGYLYVWDVMRGTLLKTLPSVTGSSRIAFVPESQNLVQVFPSGTSGVIMVWDVAQGVITNLLMHRFESLATMRDMTSDLRTGAKYSILAFDVAPDGKRLVTSSQNGDLWLWDLNAEPSEQPEWLRAGKEDEQLRLGVKQIAFSADGQTVFYYSKGRETEIIYRLDIESGTETALIDLLDAVAVGFSLDGTQMAWLCEGSLCVANLDSLAQVSEIPISLPAERFAGELDTKGMGVFRSPEQVLAFTPDGRHVVIGGYINMDSDDNVLIVVDLL